MQVAKIIESHRQVVLDRDYRRILASKRLENRLSFFERLNRFCGVTSGTLDVTDVVVSSTKLTLILGDGGALMREPFLDRAGLLERKSAHPLAGRLHSVFGR